MKFNLVTILGPTAGGKTLLAAHIARRLGTGVISADSRQVYRGMDIGTGKDVNDYIIDHQVVPSYLLDIRNAGEKYNVYEFQKDFYEIFNQLVEQGQTPVMCGGSGLYIQSVLQSYRMLEVPVNEILRKELAEKSDEELTAILAGYRKLHNTTDTITRKRHIRAIEIEVYHKENQAKNQHFPELKSLIIGVQFDRAEQKRRITERLTARLKGGMIEEVDCLRQKGMSDEVLIYYGLEYKFITQYLRGEMDYESMFRLLNIAIHQFSKRQMTWFRKMEREGFVIHWLDGNLPMEVKIEKIFALLSG
jgi:tRNA dimethylallyltransferase